MCPNCRNYGPHGDICLSCNNVDFYYNNELQDTETLQLLARAMARIMVKEPEYSIAQSYAEPLIHHYISN